MKLVYLPTMFSVSAVHNVGHCYRASLSCRILRAFGSLRYLLNITV